MARRRSHNRPLAKLLDACSMPVYLLDAGRTIVYCNSACAKWLSVPVDDLVGIRCDYHSSHDVTPEQTVAAGLCPPPEVFRGERTTGEVTCFNGDSKDLSRRRAEFMPLHQNQFDDMGVLVVVDIDGAAHRAVDGADSADARHLHQQIQAYRKELASRYKLDLLVGESTAIRRIRDQVRVAIQSRGRVLVVGPRGSGREHIAKTIHFSKQQEHATDLMVLDSSLLDAELLQSAVTQLKRQTETLHEEISRTLLLLDVDQLPGDAQHELAGFFNLPGFEMPTLATSRSSLLQLAEEGRFRFDLAASLSTLVMDLPALRTRPEDVPYLAQLFLEDNNAAGERQLSGFSPEALDQLAAYQWPGNVDELAEVVHEACTSSKGPLVSVTELPRRIHLAADAAAMRPLVDEPIVLDDFLAQIESELIQRALGRAKGNKTRAAELLGISRARLHRRISQLGIDDDG